MNLLVFNLATDLDDPVLAFTSSWIDELARRADKVHVITMRAGRVRSPSNVRVYSVGKEKGFGKPRRAVELFRHLRSVFREDRIDACFAHMACLPTVLSAWELKRRGIPILTWYSHSVVSMTTKLAFALSDVVLTAAPEIKARLGAKAVLTNHGVDLNLFRGRPPRSASGSRKTVATIGRISPVKDCVTLVRALDVLIKERRLENVDLVFYGDAPERDRGYFESLRELVRGLGLEERVRFPGALPHDAVPEALEQADVFVNMQAEGGKGKAVLEALAAGTPTLVCTPAFARDFGAWSDQLTFKEKQPEDLAARLHGLLTLPPPERETLSQHLRQIAQNHSLDHLIDTVVSSIRQTCREPAGVPS